MNLIKKENVENKTVLLRVDYNVPIDENGNITDESRIKKSLKTINFLLDCNCKIIITSHMGRIKEEKDKNKYSLINAANLLSKLLNKTVIFYNFVNVEKLNSVEFMNDSKIIMLENTRFYDLYENLEKGCSDKLSEKLSLLADVFVNDAFGVSHRKHASTYGIRNYLPSYYGFLIEEELNELNELVDIKKRPFTVFMGGAKVEDKLPIINNLLTKCDYLCLGGGILNSFLKASGEDIKDSLASSENATLDNLKKLLDRYPEKIIMSKDFIWKDNKILDIKIDSYKEILKTSEMIFINGTPGLFENPEYRKGTENLFEECVKSHAKVIVGGGDTSSALKITNQEEKIDFISSGGGASLEYITYGKLGALD